MMKRLAKWIAVFLCLVMLPLAAQAQEITFESKTLEKLTRQALGLDSNAPICQEDLAGVTKMAISKNTMDIRISNVWTEVSGAPLNRVWLDDLKHFTNLSVLRLQLGDYTADMMEGLSQCKNLREICIVADSLEEFDALQGLPKLRNVYIIADGLQSIDFLLGIEGLYDLLIQGEDFEDISALAQMDSIRHLTITDCPNVTTIEPVTQMEHIVQFNMRKTGITSLEPLRDMQVRFSLRIEDNPVDDWDPALGFGMSSVPQN